MRVSLLATSLLLAACGAAHERAPAPGANTHASDAAGPLARPSAGSGDASTPFEPEALARYTCEPGTRVALLADGSASVLLPDGARYLLDRVAGSEPPVYAGSSLYFTVSGQATYLSQQDGERELACAPDAPARGAS